MNVCLQMLGTGDAFAKNYYNNNALLTDDNYTLLIDCGITATLAMQTIGKSFLDVTATLITHIHADHVGGLGELAHTLKHTYDDKMTLLLPESLVEPLWDYMIKEDLFPKESVASLNDLFEVRTLKPGTKYPLSSSITLELIRTPHIPGKESYSILLNNDIFYSADMTFQPELLLSLVRDRGVRKILHECQLKGSGVVHTTLKELMTLPEDVRRIVKLMHYSDEKPNFIGLTGEMEFLEQHVIYKL